MIPNYAIKFHGFTLPPDVYEQLKFLMQELTEESPSDSFAKLTIHRSGALFRGIIRISSSAGNFLIFGRGQQLHKVSKKLLSDMKKQLKDWRSHRQIPDACSIVPEHLPEEQREEL